MQQQKAVTYAIIGVLIFLMCVLDALRSKRKFIDSEFSHLLPVSTFSSPRYSSLLVMLLTSHLLSTLFCTSFHLFDNPRPSVTRNASLSGVYVQPHPFFHRPNAPTSRSCLAHETCNPAKVLDTGSRIQILAQNRKGLARSPLTFPTCRFSLRFTGK